MISIIETQNTVLVSDGRNEVEFSFKKLVLKKDAIEHLKTVLADYSSIRQSRCQKCFGEIEVCFDAQEVK